MGSSWLDKDDVFSKENLFLLSADEFLIGEGLRLLLEVSDERLRWKKTLRKEWLEDLCGGFASSSAWVTVSSGGFFRIGVESEEDRLLSNC